MIEFTAKAVSILGFSIYYYGIILMFATVAGILLAKGEAKRKNKNVDFLYDSVPWLMFGGIVGARLWHIFTPPPSMVAQGITTKFYLTHPLDALNIRAGGLGIPGAVVGGLLIFYWFAKRRSEDFSDWLDIFAPAIPLGQAIGRWGNFVNQELYGAPSNLPWAIFISPENRLPEYMGISHYHPIFLYEAVWNLATMFVLLHISRRYSNHLSSGDVFLFYLISYPVIRILLDFLRLDASKVAGFNANQMFMFAVLFLSLGIVIFRRLRKRNLT